MFDDANYIGGICVNGIATYTRKQLDELTDWVKRPQIGATGLMYVRWNDDGTVKSSIDKFYNEEDLKQWLEYAGATKGDMLLIMAGEKNKTHRSQSSAPSATFSPRSVTTTPGGDASSD